MKKNKKTGLKIAAMFVPGLFVIASGITKLAGVNVVAEKIAEVGMGEFLPWLGVAEIIFAVMFMFKKTLLPGLVLLSCYFAGAVATEISHGLNGLIPLAIMSLCWASAYIRHREFFIFLSREGSRPSRSWANTSLSINK